MKDEEAARVLNAVIACLRADILPHVADDAARIRIDHVTRLLRWVSARQTVREEGLRTLLATAGKEAPADADITALEAGQCAMEGDTSAAIAALIDAGASPSEQARAIAQLLESERAYYRTLDPDIVRGLSVVYRGGRIDHEVTPSAPPAWPPITAETLTAYLRDRFGRADVAATDIAAMAGGFSKETIFFTLIDRGAGTAEKLVIRKDMPETFIGKTVLDEFALLRHLFERGLPVAEPLWLEAERSRFGGAFLVSRRVAGSADAAHWSRNPDHARAACRQFAVLLGRLHSTPPEALGYAPETATLSVGVLMEREIAGWMHLFHAKRREVTPLQEIPLLWLACNIPPALYNRPARPIHGDPGFHNLMVAADGTVTALLDWEFSGLGDPSQDIFFTRNFVTPLMDWGEFYALYLDAGGVRVCEESRFFFDLWQNARNAIGCVDAQALFHSTMGSEIKLALAGDVFGPYLYIDQCEALLKHLEEQSC